MHPWLLSSAIAYLFGSIPFGYLLVRVFRHQDIRATGSGNIGATNVMRSGARGLGIATLLLDCLKGVLAVLLAFAIARHTGLPRYIGFHMACAAAVFAVLGHVFPVWLGFRGGKGVATALGVFLVLSPASTLCALLLFLAVFAASRYVSLSSILAAISIPVCALYFVSSRTPWFFAAFFGVPLLVIAKHHDNIGRLLSGTEHRWGAQPPTAGA